MAVPLSEDQLKLLEELEEEFSERYSEKDGKEFGLKLTEEDLVPPIVENWDTRGNFSNKRRYDDSRTNSEHGSRRQDRRGYEDRGSNSGNEYRRDNRNYSRERYYPDERDRGYYRNYERGRDERR